MSYDFSGGSPGQDAGIFADYGNLTIDGDLSIKSTVRTMDNTNYGNTFTLAGNLTLDGIPDTYRSSAQGLLLNGTGPQTISILNGSGFPYANLDIANTANPVNLTGDLKMSANGLSYLTVETNAVFNANGNAIRWSDGNAGDGVATVKINTGATLNLGGGLLTYEGLINSGTLTP